MRQIGDRAVYGNPLLPDFMVFFGLERIAVVLAWHGSLLVRHVDGGCLYQDYWPFVLAGWRSFSRDRRYLLL